jgi:Asp-tRNA(Asn)/Glu-tRNA(Gln) amidotransferase A subunit family amidase
MKPGAVTATAQSIANRDVTAVAAVQEVMTRIDERDGDLGSVVALRGELALAEAAALDEVLARTGEVVGPLHGVPVLVKDLEDVAGMPTRKGSKLFENAAPASHDEVVPALLRAAGAIVVGKTNLPEFATEGFTDNLLDGPTKNPWDLRFTPGGSSGGSGAALAAGLAPIATGTDGGGSVRIPAGLCGLLGLKPTAGAVGRWPAPDWLDLSTYGPFATTAQDLGLLFSLITGVVYGDPASAPSFVQPPMTYRRVVVAERTSPWEPLPEPVRSSFLEAADRLAAVLGVPAEVIDGRDTFTSIGDPDVDWFTMCTAEHVAALGRQRVLDNLSIMHPAAASFMEEGLRVTIDEYLGTRFRRPMYTRVIDELLGQDTLLLTPILGVEAVTFDGRLPGSDSVDMLPPEVYSTPVQNITGHPAISLPAGLYPSGLPFGLQVTAPRWHDHDLIALARRWEDAFPWPRVAPGYTEFEVRS